MKWPALKNRIYVTLEHLNAEEVYKLPILLGATITTPAGCRVTSEVHVVQT